MCSIISASLFIVQNPQSQVRDGMVEIPDVRKAFQGQ
jgi:hypothetical protein